MKRLETIQEVRDWRAKVSGSLGFVPTMGALHEGHLHLVARAQKECDASLVSIFVNPTQFTDPTDLEHYPRPLEDDLILLYKSGVNAIFLPRTEEIYADQYRYQLTESRDSLVLEGAARPGHFNGVLTVVLKLFQITQPTRAYFGEKDFQQLRLIQEMAQALFLPLDVVPCPTVREVDGLALSSRNRRLSPAEREKAPLLHRALQGNPTEARRALENAGFRVDYVEELWGRRLGAAYIGGVRLIDNVEV